MSSARVCHACHSEELEHHASIDTFTVGIEYSDGYYQCTSCESWTLLSWKDSWAGEATTFRTTVSAERATEAVALIAKCKDPHDAWCRCPVHRKMERG